MMTRTTFQLLLLTVGLFAHITMGIAQAGVSINNNGLPPVEQAILDIDSRDKGVLIPRVTTDERMNIADPPTTVLPTDADGLMVFDTDLHQICYWNETITDWQCIDPDGGSGTGSTGGSGAPWSNSWSPLSGLIDAHHTVLPNSWSYYYNAVIPQDMTLTQVLMWNDSGSDPLRVGIFSGSASASGPNTGSMLVGQGVDGGVSGPKIFSMTAEPGQNLDFVAGELVCIGFAQGGTTSYMWAAENGPLGNTIAWKNNSDFEGGSGFNANPQTGTPTAIRLIMEFY
ncbi:hypothetical protein OAE48_00440 [Flavobacteriales bacterium]|nr:hypothetical protein [Flavobacteriales bacterium]